MVKDTALYDVLGLSPGASDQEIKKAYRKKALEFHPDKATGDAEMFKKVGEAHEILSDSQKRSVYDQYGMAGLEGGAGGMGGGMDASELFSQFFGGGGFGGGRRNQGPRKGKDITHTIACTLEELYAGKKSKLALSKSVICDSCSGVGGKAGSVQTCSGCKGQGIKVVLRQMGPMVQRVQMECDECNGNGEKIAAKDRCQTCSGKKTVNKREILEVFIDRGMKQGDKITFNGAADQYPGIEPGDITIVVEEKPHEFFKRKGDNLYCNQDIDLLTALGGGRFSIKHLDNHVLIVDIIKGEIIKPGATKVIADHGMPAKRHHDLGLLFVTFNVIFPDKIAPELIPSLEAALPARGAMTNIPKGSSTEDVVLQDVDESRSSRTEAMDEDEDEHGHGGRQGPEVQCANQ